MSTLLPEGTTGRGRSPAARYRLEDRAAHIEVPRRRTGARAGLVAVDERG